MKWLVRLYPRAWRERYGDEVLDLLATSRRPVRDRADVVVRALLLRAAGLRRSWLVPALLVAAGGAGLVWATPQLADGLTEVPSHWWSTAAALPLVLGAPWLGWALLRRRAPA